MNPDIADITAINCEPVYEFPYILIYGTVQPSFVKLKYTPVAKNDNELQLGETLTNNQLLTASATKKLIENHKEHMLTSLNASMDNYALKNSIDEL